ELLLGLALGLTLGSIGYVRGWLTPEEVRQNPVKRRDAFEVKVPKGEPLSVDEQNRTVSLPPKVVILIHEQHAGQVSWEEGTELRIDDKTEPGYLIYHFPEKCTVRHEAVSRWRLALVISQAVAAICLWGTLIGSMLPIIFKSFGVDPGIASSPFVAT